MGWAIGIGVALFLTGLMIGLPHRWARGIWICFFSLIASLGYLNTWHWSNSGLGELFYVGVLLFPVLGMAVIYLIRCIVGNFLLLWDAWDREGLPTAAKKPSRMSRVLKRYSSRNSEKIPLYLLSSSLLGIFATFGVVRILGTVFELKSAGVFLEIGVILTVSLILYLGWKFHLFVGRPNTKMFAMVAGIGLCGLSVFSLHMPSRLLGHGDELANGRPYCVYQVGKPYSDGGHPAKNWRELTFFTGRKMRWPSLLPDNDMYGNHLALYVQNGSEFKTYHWSYRQMSWKPQALYHSNSAQNGTEDYVCPVQENYMKKLPF